MGDVSIEPVQPHHATDRRCYDGAYSSDLQREVNQKDKAKRQIKALGGRITYFPAGEFYVGFDGVKILTDDCSSFWQCYQITLDHFKKKNS